MISAYDPDIFILVETWLERSINIPNYEIT